MKNTNIFTSRKKLNKSISLKSVLVVSKMFVACSNFEIKMVFKELKLQKAGFPVNTRLFDGTNVLFCLSTGCL